MIPNTASKKLVNNTVKYLHHRRIMIDFNFLFFIILRNGRDQAQTFLGVSCGEVVTFNLV